ncbi:hypothetical protein W911_12965 [Hyphomicrobium nitrativorans NL23]|uniref:Calcineurin-like phosphoesterase domain-containing protein n=1 Tax=Hyphomicrobium nitrativorans NL23 TaxID=1029756 RepID=V5SIB3_9HYPH|nr:metallophosphoesterase [Hyphomicrobium nitrativorans]AHB50278.1 hypothetical protein W911_12965 [Hyphomicrobium nitrativorans NL23]
MAIWDLRKGDADDDRMSPGGRGMRAIVMSALFEFNVVQAALAFVALVLLPAFLVGLVPSLLQTYGTLVMTSVRQLWSEPLWAGLVIAALALVAYKWGRMRYASAARSLWKLHYTLVFPIFVLVREAVKIAGERWLGPHATLADLMARRRLGTIVSGGLFAGLSLAIATTLILTTGIVSVSLATASPRMIVRAAVIDGLMVLAFSTVVASLYWTWRELSVPPPELAKDKAHVPESQGVLRVAHLSDLHLVGSRHDFRMEPGTRGPQGNARWQATAAHLAEMDRTAPFDVILITGDVTDTGARAEWVEFLEQIDANAALRERVLILPGNHDVNICDRWNAGRLEMPWSAGLALRKLRFIVAADQVQGERVRLVCSRTGELKQTLREALRDGERLHRLQALARDGNVRGRWLVSQLWRDLFPMVVPPGTGGRPGVILLNSCTDSHMALTNGIGAIEPRQLQALERLLERHGEARWLLALHHQVIEYAAFGIPLKERFGLSLINAPDLLASIGARARQAVVLHGHRHRNWVGMCGALQLCSVPSSTLGAHDTKYGPGLFHLHEMAWGETGRIWVTATETVVVPDAEATAYPEDTSEA